KKMAASPGQKMAAGKNAGPHILPRIESTLPGHVHEKGRPSTAHANNSALGQGFHEAVAKLHRLLDRRRTRRGEVVGVDMHVSQPGEQIRLLQVDHLRLTGVRSMANVRPV